MGLFWDTTHTPDPHESCNQGVVDKIADIVNNNDNAEWSFNTLCVSLNSIYAKLLQISFHLTGTFSIASRYQVRTRLPITPSATFGNVCTVSATVRFLLQFYGLELAAWLKPIQVMTLSDQHHVPGNTEQLID